MHAMYVIMKLFVEAHMQVFSHMLLNCYGLHASTLLKVTPLTLINQTLISIQHNITRSTCVVYVVLMCVTG